MIYTRVINFKNSCYWLAALECHSAPSRRAFLAQGPTELLGEKKHRVSHYFVFALSSKCCHLFLFQPKYSTGTVLYIVQGLFVLIVVFFAPCLVWTAKRKARNLMNHWLTPTTWVPGILIVELLTRVRTACYHRLKVRRSFQSQVQTYNLQCHPCSEISTFP